MSFQLFKLPIAIEGHFINNPLYLLMKKTILIIASLFITTLSFTQQYNKVAGKNKIMIPATTLSGERVMNSQGEVQYKAVTADKYGNAKGNQYDLAVDGAFEGQIIAVLHFNTPERFDFKLPKSALQEKGFSIYRWLDTPPSPAELEKSLEEACQLWIISTSTQLLNKDHLKVIKDFFDSGKGIYIWGDNDPLNTDANYVAEALLGTTMSGDVYGGKSVGVDFENKKIGLAPNHLITTGLQNVYEGITIATIKETIDLEPIIYGSAGNLVTAVYEKDGKRAILDGGFTRLYIKWDTAGTARYVKNAAAWLANAERFGDQVAK